MNKGNKKAYNTSSPIPFPHNKSVAWHSLACFQQCRHVRAGTCQVWLSSPSLAVAGLALLLQRSCSHLNAGRGESLHDMWFGTTLFTVGKPVKPPRASTRFSLLYFVPQKWIKWVPFAERKMEETMIWLSSFLCRKWNGIGGFRWLYMYTGSYRNF